ncbi:biotin carboxylase N-terminal domain-containing protein [uncultured Arthrobacter sp.]|uniref:biotin carboxylase N-terminal domain-containing protein n=1 Tax=uncultured Arthrobacter sp. TaxID=114050 RepID=UPI0028D69DF5|nr:biotin carboxylase N-terminal domain-containing protein [uncultured Arthrobacter sp.]
MFARTFVADRCEIAIRSFRAADELDVRTAAVYAYEDRDSVHRLKADQAFRIRDLGAPAPAHPPSRRRRPTLEKEQS